MPNKRYRGPGKKQRVVRRNTKHPFGVPSDRYYNDPQYKEFRDAVRKRDKYKCQWPNCVECKPNKLQVHHIRPWTKYLYLRFNPDNGILICRLHHKLVTGNEDHFISLFTQIVAQNKCT